MNFRRSAGENRGNNAGWPTTSIRWRCISFYEGLEYDSPRATPKDPARWTFERFSDYRVRWTYRITNEDHDEAVRQTLERWADRDEEEKECV